MAEKVRMNLLMSAELHELLRQLADESGVTKAEVIRHGLALLKVAHENKKKGRHIGFAKDPDNLDQEIIGVL